MTIKFMSVDAAQFCSCKNPINCRLSMNKTPADACFVQSVKHKYIDLGQPNSVAPGPGCSKPD